MRKIKIKHIAWIILLLLYSPVFGQQTGKSGTNAGQKKNSTVQEKRRRTSVNSQKLKLPNDSIVADTTANKDESGFDTEVKWTAEGYISMVQDSSGSKILMYKNADVRYKDIELKADYIELNRDSNVVYAIGKPDTTGQIVGKPVFTQNGEKFEADEIRYNFQTKKGIVFGVVTQKEGGFIHSGRTKLINDSTYNLINGKYTTCDYAHPHFYLQMTKAKVLSNKKIVTGPAYLVVEDLPIYFVFVPFGFFPVTSKYSSGILVPSYGEEVTRGFFLRDLGYYWAASDYFDAAIKGDLYSLGSTGVKFHSNYKLRYRFTGGLDIKLYKNVFGDKGLPDYRTQNDFAISWNHAMDSKASTNQTFSASVDFSTSQYDQYNSYSARNILTNTKQSSVSYSKRWENSPFMMTGSLRHSQNSRDTTISLTLPQLTFNMTRIYPFKPKYSSGKEKWYEKIGLTYTMDIQNTINTKENKLLSSNLFRDWKNGIRQSIPVSTSFKALKFVTISPSFNYNERWYSQQIRKSYNQQLNQVVVSDTIFGFTRDYDYSMSVSASTKIYGNYIPYNPNSSIKQIRHVMTPSLSFSLRPDFSNPNFGMYENIEYFDKNGLPVSLRYPVHEGGVYGTASSGKSGSIGFSLNNTLEMKKLNIKDTVSTETYKKISLLDQLSLSGSYNLAADSLNLSNLNVSARTKVAGVDVNFGAILDPYAFENGHLINQYELTKNGRLARLTSANLSFGLSFTSKTDKDKNKTAQTTSDDAAIKQQKEIEEQNRRQQVGEVPEYADFSVPWNVRLDYSFRYSRPDPKISPVVTQTVDFNGDVNLTKQWKIGFSSGIDIQKMDLTFTQLNIFRDLHCMQMSLNLIPFGFRQSYAFTIRATSQLLKDLKLTKNQSFYDISQF